MGMRQTLISALQLSVQNEGLLEALSAKKTTAIAWDFVQNENGIQPLVRAMGEIAGNTAVLLAGELMASVSGQGTMLGGVSGVRPSEVVILGAGTVGEYATRSALGLGASVKVFDNSVHRLIRLQNAVGQRLWTSTLQPSVLEEALRTADVAIGAVRGSGSRAPMLVSEPMIAGMRERSIVVDVSIDRGGVFETSRLTSHERPTFIECGVIHYCVPNIPSTGVTNGKQGLEQHFRAHASGHRWRGWSGSRHQRPQPHFHGCVYVQRHVDQRRDRGRTELAMETARLAGGHLVIGVLTPWPR